MSALPHTAPESLPGSDALADLLARLDPEEHELMARDAARYRLNGNSHMVPGTEAWDAMMARGWLVGNGLASEWPPPKPPRARSAATPPESRTAETLRMIGLDGKAAPTPPESRTAEASLLALLPSQPGTLQAVLDLLAPEDFLDDFNRHWYRAVKSCAADGKPIDLAHIREALPKHVVADAGFRQRVDHLADSKPASSTALDLAAIVKNKASLRALQDDLLRVVRQIHKPNASADELAREAIRRVEGLAVGADGDEWERPQLDLIEPAAPFPLDVFPEALAELSRVAGEVIFCPPDFIAGPALAVAGSAVGKSVGLKVLDWGWVEYASMYMIGAARPGSGKTQGLKLIVEPAQELTESMLEQHQFAMRMFEEARLKREAGAVANAAEYPQFPVRNLVEDFTVPSLAKLLHQNPRGLLAAFDELSGWIEGMNMHYPGGKGNDRQFFLKVWSFASLPIDRKGQDGNIPTWIRNTFLTIVGFIQPKLIGLLDPTRDDGFMDRFLLMFPEHVPRDHPTRHVPVKLAAAWGKAYQRLWTRRMATDRKSGRLTPTLVGLTPEAKRRFQEWYSPHCKMVEDKLYPDHLYGASIKMLTYAARIALAVEQIHWAYSPKKGTESVSHVGVESVERSIALVGYYMNHLRRVHATRLGIKADNPLARSILEWARKGRRDSFTEKQLRDNYGDAIATQGEDVLFRALDWLTNRKAIRAAEVTTRKVGRPASPRYLLNPHLTRNPR